MEITNDRIKQLQKDFIRAEREIKKTELADNAIPLPPINELRYSYNHFLSALMTGKEDDFRSAEKHIKRAIYDAVDVRLVTGLEAIKEFQNEFSNTSISDVISDWSNKLVQVRKIQEAIADNDDGNTRSERLEAHIKHSEALKNIYDICDVSRDELRKKIELYNKKTRKDITNIIIALAAIVVTIVVAILFS